MYEFMDGRFAQKGSCGRVYMKFHWVGGVNSGIHLPRTGEESIESAVLLRALLRYPTEARSPSLD